MTTIDAFNEDCMIVFRCGGRYLGLSHAGSFFPRTQAKTPMFTIISTGLIHRSYRFWLFPFTFNNDIYPSCHWLTAVRAFIGRFPGCHIATLCGLFYLGFCGQNYMRYFLPANIAVNHMLETFWNTGVELTGWTYYEI